MKHKTLIFSIIAAVLVLGAIAGLCVSGIAGAAFQRIRLEIADIAEFFAWTPVASTVSVPVSQIGSDPNADPILKAVYHTENLPSVYVTAEEYAELTEAETYGYTAIPRFESNDIETIRAALDLAGIEPTLVTRRNPAPENDVYAIRFAGLSDADAYYINPACEVMLYVSAAKPTLPEAAEDGSNVVYLTYDDGPTYADTIRLLDVLDTYGVKATFFTVGTAVQSYPASARAIAERGHAIGCHSVTHVYKDIYASTEALEKELLEWESLVTTAGITLDDNHKLFRFPGGSNNSAIETGTGSTAAMTAMLASHSYRAYDWNVVTNDAVLYTAPDGMGTYDYIRETFAETFAAKAETGQSPIIILMHETVSETIDLMPWMIEFLIENGYTFGTLDEIDPWMFGME